MLRLLVIVAFSALNLVLFVEAFLLSRIFRSRAWGLIAAGAAVAAIRTLWGLAQLPTQMARMTASSTQLSARQWLYLALTLTTIGLFCLGFDRLRRDLRKFGVK